MEFEIITKAVCDVLGVHSSEITEETNFTVDLGADSLDLYQVIMQVERELGIEVPAEELAGISTVADAITVIKNAE